jgi:ribosomal protein S18 acetylase RimI-like enzyme
MLTVRSQASCIICFIAPAGPSRTIVTCVAETARNLGLGRTLIEAVEREARAAGASRVYWLTKEDNVTARKLYDRVAERSGFIQYRKLF